MKTKIYLITILILFLVVFFPKVVNAGEITNSSKITVDGDKINAKLTDDKESTYLTISEGKEIKIVAEENIQGVYIIYDIEGKEGKLTGNGKTIDIGKYGFIHEYIDVKKEIGDVTEVSFEYDDDVKVADIYVIGDGKVPDFVEMWEPPCEKADILLFSTHGDDEQLFFLGLMPTYVARGAYFQVVYFANHKDNSMRYHEQVHGLYAVGIRNYPIFGIVPDAYSETLKAAISNMEAKGVKEEEAKQWQVEMIRRFKPQVVVGHDEKGEYSHGQHILNTYLLEDAIDLANDETYDTKTVEKYGVWGISKLYIHLYEKNKITMDYDTPLDYFDGKTAYEVSKIGYSKHNSQQWTWFTKWINGANNSYKKATEITKYSPLEFGLYYTNVGDDEEKDDMMEHIKYYKEQEKEEELKRQQEEANKKDNIKEENGNESEGESKIDIKVIVIIFVAGVVLILFSFMKPNKKSRKKGKRKAQGNYKKHSR